MGIAIMTGQTWVKAPVIQSTIQTTSSVDQWQPLHTDLQKVHLLCS